MPVKEPTEEIHLMVPVKKERHLTDIEKLLAKGAAVATVVASIFGAGWKANEGVGKVLVEQIAIKKEQTAQRILLDQAVTKEYFREFIDWKMEQATTACFNRTTARLEGAKVPVICPKFPIRGMPFICHFSTITATQ